MPLYLQNRNIRTLIDRRSKGNVINRGVSLYCFLLILPSVYRPLITRQGVATADTLLAIGCWLLAVPLRKGEV
jgi:hypothetical protein